MNKGVIAVIFGVAMLATGCASVNKAQVQMYPQVRSDAKKVVMMPTFGMGSDDASTKVVETQVMASFHPLPGAEIARQIGIYDKLRPVWEKTMNSLMNDPSGALDATLSEVLSKIGNASGVDALLVSAIQGSETTYNGRTNIHIVCGLYDLRDKSYRWVGSYIDARGIAPIPFKAFVANAVNDISKGVVEQK